MRKIKSVLLVLVVLGLFPLTVSTAMAVEPIFYPGDDGCISLEKTGPATAMIGDTITFHFTVTNCGDASLLGAASVYDPLLYDPLLYPNVGDLIWREHMNPADGDGLDLDPNYPHIQEFDMDYTVQVEDVSRCTLTNDAWAVGIYFRDYSGIDYSTVDNDDSTDWTVSIVGGDCGTGTPGYWKNHPEAWPVTSITIGGISYAMDDAIDYMEASGNKDKTFTMFRALVSAKLNVINNPSSCIDAIIAEADGWMVDYGPVGSIVAARSDAWGEEGEPLYEALDDYNNGLLCAPHRD